MYSSFRNCEFLNKLDLTVNFIDVDTLEESITHLQSRERLKDLYMMGNPSQTNWSGFNSYIIAKLPQLQALDGQQITKSMQIVAQQQLGKLEVISTILYLIPSFNFSNIHFFIYIIERITYISCST